MDATTASVVVLNKHFLPIDVMSAAKAMGMVYVGSASVLTEEYERKDWNSWADIPPNADEIQIRTVDKSFKVPAVIVIEGCSYVGRRKCKFNRRNVFIRDQNICQYCGQRFPIKELSLDHVVPSSRGGKMTWANIVCACIKCNLRKGNKTLEKAGMKLIKKPETPTWSPLFRLSKRDIERMINYRSVLDIQYWMTDLEG